MMPVNDNRLDSLDWIPKGLPEPNLSTPPRGAE
jgi:hypothetical protein